MEAATSELNWLLLDLNSFFASVEQQENPRLRGKPVAVVPMLADSTCCIAASYEAKAFGVKTGTGVGEAKKLCPGIVLIEGGHGKYTEYHHRVVEAIESCLPVTHVLSIDEMACRLGGRDRDPKNAIALAREVKVAVLRKVGSQLKSSVGLATNRLLAKVASDMQKPDGLTVLAREDLPHKLMRLKLRDFPGIGPRMERRLVRQGIQTTEKLLSLSVQEMARVWGGIVGERYWHWLRGEETHEEETRRRSLGHEHVLPPLERTREGAYRVLLRLTQKAAARLRRAGLWANGIAIGIRYLREEEGFSYSTRLVECQDTLTFIQCVREMYEKSPDRKPIKVGVTLHDLVQDGFHTPSLYENPKREELSRAIDRINAKFGSNSLYFGGIHGHTRAAPTRIAFQRIPEREEFDD